MNPQIEMVTAVYAAQGILALVLSAFFFRFYRDYRHAYLVHWGLSFVAMAMHVFSAALVLVLLALDVSTGPRTLVSAVSMASLYAQAALLLAGVVALSIGRRVIPRRLIVLVAMVALLGASSVLIGAFDPGAAELRLFVRVGMRHVMLGAVFLLAAWVIWRHSTRELSSGAGFLAIVMFIYGLHLMHGLLAQILVVGFHLAIPYLAYLPLVDLLFYALIGLGLVIWLLQQEQQVASTARSEASRLNFYDPLTELPNRRNLETRLQRAIRTLRDTDLKLAFAFADVERFRRLNDSMGHASGDEVLRILARRLLTRLPEGGTVARVGADEFAFILPELRGEEEARSHLTYLMEGIREPIRVHGQDIHLSYSCGFALFPDDGRGEQVLVRSADLAHSRARQRKGELLLRYQPGMESDASERLIMEAELRRALSQDELLVHYQPIMDREGRVASVEALVRWQHPERGLLTPEQFLPLVTTMGLSPQLDYWVLEQACRQLAAWKKRGLSLGIAVNLSAQLFEQPELPARVERILRRSGAPAELVQLELTEQVAMDDTETGHASLGRLRSLGVGLSLDDFGTGYSSLSWLRQFPVHRLKIDRSFIAEMSEAQGQAVVESIIGLAHALDLRTTAEGVESEWQWQILHGLGCDLFQGFHFSAALPAEDLEAFVRRNRLHLVSP
ncbi:putative bifunctional diguanylate cyclase/phosphodiesterase [Natronospira bacteriovora]|uniref:Bifunctional diguanylate cyclase/phosphodiesterase n=1 Tax=Natronospira bacteriovora TaxID=3069753 RepID=A0ABU0W429_9GAMM|nr:bifunctional diguanylate cyclase/phosphodiesterase [Natronospira sp. AB-CW4]MDQ2068721.1 bifunctional diguanylate cyclase/phosphodiesterase [Natronospira sp. AB-CW4]